MKKIVLPFILILLSTNFVLGKTFRVVVVTKGVTSNLGIVSPLDTLSSSVVIEVPKDNYVALIDDFTNLYEFYGQETVLLDSLQGSASIKPLGPDIGRIYSAEAWPGRPVVRHAADLHIVLPFPYSSVFNIARGQEICTEWVFTREFDMPGEYNLVLTDQFSDVLLEQQIHGTRACFLPPAVRSRKREFSIFYSIQERGNAATPTDLKGIAITNLKANDVSLNLDSPIVNVLAGLYCEELGMKTQAFGYFERAKALALSIEEYEDIFEMFRVRNGM